MKTRKTTRWIGLFLSILMLVALLGAVTLSVSAAEAVSDDDSEGCYYSDHNALCAFVEV